MGPSVFIFRVTKSYGVFRYKKWDPRISGICPGNLVVFTKFSVTSMWSYLAKYIGKNKSTNCFNGYPIKEKVVNYINNYV